MSEERESNVTKPAAVPPPKVSAADAPETDTPSDLLWHFTSLDGLPKILLGDDGLLAGHTSFMDDPDDCTHRNILRGELCKALYPLAYNDTTGRLLRDIAQKRVDYGAFFPVFVACFTDDDALSDPKMWETRTKDGGFAIGFRKKDLLQSLKKVVHCEYPKTADAEREIDDLRTKLAKYDVRDPKAEPTNDEILELKQISDRCDQLVGRKRESFSWERETRAVIDFEWNPPSDRIRFIGAKPFVTLPLEKPIRHYVEKIVISPFGDLRKSHVIAQFVATAIGLTPDDIYETQLTIKPETRYFHKG